MFLGLSLAEEGLSREAFPLLKEAFEHVINRCNKWLAIGVYPIYSGVSVWFTPLKVL